MGKLKLSLYIKVSSVSISSVGQEMTFYQWNRCSHHSHQQFNYLMKRHLYIARSEIKGPG